MAAGACNVEGVGFSDGIYDQLGHFPVSGVLGVGVGIFADLAPSACGLGQGGFQYAAFGGQCDVYKGCERLGGNFFAKVFCDCLTQGGFVFPGGPKRLDAVMRIITVKLCVEIEPVDDPLKAVRVEPGSVEGEWG